MTRWEKPGERLAQILASSPNYDTMGAPLEARMELRLLGVEGLGFMGQCLGGSLKWWSVYVACPILG